MSDFDIIADAARVFKKYSYLRIFCDFKREQTLTVAYQIVARILSEDPKTEYAFWGDCSLGGNDSQFWPKRSFTNVTCHTHDVTLLNYRKCKNIITEKDTKYRKGYKIICILDGKSVSSAENCIQLGMPIQPSQQLMNEINDTYAPPKTKPSKMPGQPECSAMSLTDSELANLIKRNAEIFEHQKSSVVKVEKPKPNGPFGFVSFKEN